MTSVCCERSRKMPHLGSNQGEQIQSLPCCRYIMKQAFACLGLRQLRHSDFVSQRRASLTKVTWRSSLSMGRESRTPASSLEGWRASITLHPRELPLDRAEVTGLEPATDQAATVFETAPSPFGSLPSGWRSTGFRLSCFMQHPNRNPGAAGRCSSGGRNRTCDWTGNNRLPVPTRAPPDRCRDLCLRQLRRLDSEGPRRAVADKRFSLSMAMYGIEPLIQMARGLQPRSDPTLKHRQAFACFGLRQPCRIDFKKSPTRFRWHTKL